MASVSLDFMPDPPNPEAPGSQSALESPGSSRLSPAWGGPVAVKAVPRVPSSEEQVRPGVVLREE